LFEGPFLSWIAPSLPSFRPLPSRVHYNRVSSQCSNARLQESPSKLVHLLYQLGMVSQWRLIVSRCKPLNTDTQGFNIFGKRFPIPFVVFELLTLIAQSIKND
jgi:hypothetical protein